MPVPTHDDCPLEAVRVSQPELDGIMAGHGDHRQLTVTLKATMGPPSPVAIIRNDITIACADDYDAAELERNVPHLSLNPPMGLWSLTKSARIVVAYDAFLYRFRDTKDSTPLTGSASPHGQNDRRS